MRRDQQRYRTFTRRAVMLAGGKTLLLSALVGRMYYLQVIEAEKFAVLAEDNRINIRLLPPPRGRILDRFGVPLAVNDQNYRAVIVAEQTPSLEATLRDLSRIIPLSEDDIGRILRERAHKRAFVPITVRENLSWTEVARIEVNTPDLPGVSIEVGQTRDYPFAGSAVHVLGYVAAVSESELTGDPLLELPGFRIGKTGIEKRYDEFLRGSAGASQIEVNAVGRVIRELSRDEGQPGQDLVLTLDMALQQFAQQRLASELSGAAVVLDVHSGEVLALASTPTFDPNAFNRGINWSQWQNLVSNPLRPLADKAVSGQYAPGSTFKVVVALAALEAGIDPKQKVYCPGYVTLGNARFHCWRHWGHGRLDMMGGIKHSCDVYFYEAARQIGIDAIAAMARRFGLGAPTGIGLPGEQGGLIPDRNWKLANIGEPWQLGETLIAGIGQGFILTTPLQLAVMVARIANGGYAVTPRLTKPSVAGADGTASAPPPFPSMGIDPARIELIQAAMGKVTNELHGTAYGARIEEPGMAMAGKSGTAQVRRITAAERAKGVIDNEDLPWKRRDHALFVAFAPVQAPSYAVAVVIEHGGGGSAVAAPIARDILIETQRRDPTGRLPRQEVALAEP